MGVGTISRSSDWSKALFASGVAILAIILVSLWANQVIAQRVRSDAALVAHTFEVLGSLDQVLALARDAETGQRGYLIAGDDSYLEPYNTALASLDSETAHLTTLTNDNPVQQARVSVVRERVDAKIAELHETIELRRSRGFDAARAVVVSGRGKVEMDALRSVIGEMRESERALLAVRSVAAERSYRDVTIAQWIAAAASVGGLALFVLILRRQLAQLRALHRAASAAAGRLQATLHSIGDAVVTTDLEGRVHDMNAVAEELTGWSTLDARGRPLAEVFVIVNEATRAAVDNPVMRALSDGVVVGLANHTVLIARDGTERLIDDSAAPIREGDGALAGCVLVFRDVSDQKRREHELRSLATALEAADRRKDEFLATLAHELRNPLAPLRNSLEIMKLAATNTAVIDQSRAVMERQLLQMVRLVDDLLDVSRISSGKLHLDTVRLSLFDVLHHAVETSRPLIDAAAHELQIELPPEPLIVTGDATRLEQVFANLLNNAAKYSDKGSRIGITVARDNDEAVVRIRDTGVGIPVDMLSAIFELFTQVDRSLDRTYGGLGIGLTLVKRLVEMHGGRITAASEGPGRGSEFTVRLPLASPATDGPHIVSPSNTSPGDAPPLSILIADDNVDSATSLAMILELMGHRVATACHGREAVAMAGQHRPDVILLDIGMPALNGYDAGSAIRAIDPSWRPVLIALTGWGQAEDRRRSEEAGFDHHVVKPIDPAELQRLLKADAG